MWRMLQEEFDLDLDARRYRIDRDGRLVEVLDAPATGAGESAVGVASILATRDRDDLN